MSSDFNNYLWHYHQELIYVIQFSLITFFKTEYPILQLKRDVECNISNPVTLDCHVDGFLPWYGFSPWTHLAHGMVIRYISGLFIKERNTSTLYIDPCKLDDIGTYTCNVITLDKRELTWTNSSTLVIKGKYDSPPKPIHCWLYAFTKVSTTRHILCK